MYTYTAKRLETLVARLAKTYGVSDTPYIAGKAQIGAVHLGYHYGGYYSLDTIDNDAGGIHQISDVYSVREMDAWLLGAIAAKGVFQ